MFASPTLWSQVRYSEITREAGINFRQNNGAFGKKYLPETMGSGVCFLDYNSDGWLDIFLVNGKDWTGNRGKASYPALYRNEKNGRFTDVTRQAGLQVEFYGMGCGAADYDNDGDVDLYVSGLNSGRLFQNQAGTFRDVTSSSGLAPQEFGSSVAWFDYDRDGLLDLFIANYVKWSIETDIFCSLDGTSKSYCTPESYQGASPRLYRNLGGSRFRDVTREAGIFDEANKGLGVLIFDYNRDGWPDIMLANDTQPNRLWENDQDGTFTEVGMLAGVAFSEDGMARGAMGIDAGDYDHSGLLSVVIGNFSNEMMALYHNEGSGLFIDEAPTSTVGPATLLTLAFGCFFFDFNLDGYLDIYVANGHVENDINRVQERVTYAQPPHLFQNLQGKAFQEVTARMGAAFAAPRVARGAAYGDIDNDGDLDIIVTTSGGPVHLFRNDGGNQNNWVTLRLEGSRSNRSAIGAKVTVRSGALRQTAFVRTASSYLSQSQLPLTFGLNRAAKIDEVEIEWPSGTRQRLTQVPINRIVNIHEERGVN